MSEPTIQARASAREGDAWDARYKHGKAAREWDRVGEERPGDKSLCSILASWMADYETADALAESSFRALAAGGADAVKAVLILRLEAAEAQCEVLRRKVQGMRP